MTVCVNMDYLMFLRLNKLYIDYLKEKGITEKPILKVLNIEEKNYNLQEI